MPLAVPRFQRIGWKKSAIWLGGGCQGCTLEDPYPSRIPKELWNESPPSEIPGQYHDAGNITELPHPSYQDRSPHFSH